MRAPAGYTPGMRPLVFLVAVLLVSGCGEGAAALAVDGGATIDAASPDLAPPPDLRRIIDDDVDGLDDIQEMAWAAAYLPFLSISPGDGCDTMGLLVRVRPHPKDPMLVHILYNQLYDRDCGIGGHAGDDEVFGVTVDPSKPPPDGILAIRAISHQGTACERKSDCGKCPGQKPCTTLPYNGKAWPAIWPSRDKHGSYVNRQTTCTLLTTCFDTCEDRMAYPMPPMVNAGEPGHPLVHDLTTEGFITMANGWKENVLFNFDPWVDKDFGGGGSLAKDLVDTAFETPACR